jgi:hypothetical protein
MDDGAKCPRGILLKIASVAVFMAQAAAFLRWLMHVQRWVVISAAHGRAKSGGIRGEE